MCLSGSDNVLMGLFYQDKLMKYNHECYPEVLMVLCLFSTEMDRAK